MPRSSRSLVGLVSALLVALPAYAHKTEVSGNVAGTWHLEPNHSPKAGEPAQVWVALTQQGGQPIPLEQCDCQLAVYKANQPDSAPVMTPVLAALSPENFQRIPGAEVTFPAVGEYRLVLTGRPRAGANFSPFELSYTTVVAAGSGQSAAQPAQANSPDNAPEPLPSAGEATAPTQPQSQSGKPWILGILAGGATLACSALLMRQRKPPNR